MVRRAGRQRVDVPNATDAIVALFNGASVRVDDVLPPGPVTEYDIIRIHRSAAGS